MSNFSPTNLCEAVVLEADGVDREYEVAPSAFAWGYLLVDFEPDDDVTLKLAMEISSDGTNWYGVYVHDLMAEADVDVQAASITLTTDTADAVLAFRVPAPFVRLVATPEYSGSSSGPGPECTFTARLMLVG